MLRGAYRLTGLCLAVAAVVPATAAAAAPAPEAGARIVGGQPASRAYPYAALLKLTFPNLSGSARCGGSLVAARYVVTAAHCLEVEDKKPTSIDVTLGSTSASAPPNFTANPALARSHPSYGTSGPGGGYDVAVLQLNQAADFEQLRVLRPGEANLWQAGTTATVIGWGMTDDPNQGGTSSDTLREVQIPVFSDQSCTSDFQSAGAPNGFFAPLTMVCAGGKDGKDSCQGDSGGPLLVPDGGRFALAGLVSFGAVLKDQNQNQYSCAEGLPGVYSRVGVDPLNAFIRQNVPQVEIDAEPALPEPGQTVSLKAVGTNPTAPYEIYEWDLDGDGEFDDATGTSASVVTPRGITGVGVRATRAGVTSQRDREIRRLDLDARFRSPVSFAAATLQVTEGQPLTVLVNKAGQGAGGVTVGATTGTAAIGGVDVGGAPATPLTFAEGQASQTITIPTIDDRLVEATETFRLDLSSYGGDLLPGSPTQLSVTILDNDAAARIRGRTRSAKVRRGRIRLRYTITRPATVLVGVTARRGRTVYAARKRRHARRGTYTTSVRLTRAGRAALRRHRTVSGRALYAVVSGDTFGSTKILKFSLRR